MSHTTILTVPEVQTALRLAGLPPAATSPFAGLSPPATIEPPVVASLQSKGVVNGNGRPSPQWIPVLRTLTTPTHRVSFFLGSEDRWFEAGYYGNADGLIGFNQNPQECGVTFPANPSDVEALIGDWLNWTAMPESQPFAATLMPAEVTAFAAMVDAFREETLRAFLERRAGEATRFSREQLAAQLQHVDSPDSRWLCPVLKRHAPPPLQPDMQALNAGARSLASRGLARFEGDGLVIEGELFRILAGMANIVPYAYLSVQQAGAAGASVIYLTGLKCYWVFDFPGSADGQPMCRFQSFGGHGVAAHVRGLLEGLPAARAATAGWGEPSPAAPAWQPDPPRFDPPRPDPPRPNPPKPQPTGTLAKHCAKCGKPLKPGKKFCGSCGAPV